MFAGFKPFLLKGVCTGLTLILGGSLFAAGALGSDRCGIECCCKSGPTHMQHLTEKQIQAQMGCCSGVLPRPCDLKSANPFELPEIVMASCSRDSSHAVGPLNFVDDSPDTNFNPGGNSFSKIVDPQFNSPPLYLQKLSFLI